MRIVFIEFESVSSYMLLVLTLEFKKQNLKHEPSNNCPRRVNGFVYVVSGGNKNDFGYCFHEHY